MEKSMGYLRADLIWLYYLVTEFEFGWSVWVCDKKQVQPFYVIFLPEKTLKS